MAKSFITAVPPLISADHKKITLDMTVFGVDTNCNKDRVPKIEVLKVIQLDLGPRRSIRLRRSNGTEYTWSAQESRKACRTSDQFVFGYRKNAKKIAIQAANEQLKEIIQEENDGDSSLGERLAAQRESHQSEMLSIRRDYRKGLKKINAYKAMIKKIK